jgi:hypothetical protein
MPTKFKLSQSFCIKDQINHSGFSAFAEIIQKVLSTVREKTDRKTTINLPIHITKECQIIQNKHKMLDINKLFEVKIHRAQRSAKVY